MVEYYLRMQNMTVFKECYQAAGAAGQSDLSGTGNYNSG